LQKLVYRVNWLRAKARFTRWEEEVKIVKNEMENTLAWFMHQQDKWYKRGEAANGNELVGLKCYARKQVLLWEVMGEEARETFKSYLQDKS
jgi:hypothetical protein